jgi:glucosamine 6-phosphate synthetase-like amidotransferase/phosphosugar isomerase protein
MQYQKKQLKGVSEMTADMTLDYDPLRPRFSDKFSFVKFMNKESNAQDCLDETLNYLDKISNLDDYLFSLGIANWKSKEGDKNFQLVFNKNEEIIIAFEGDILNRDYLKEFLLLASGKPKEVISAQKNSANLFSENNKSNDTHSDEELLLNLYKHFLNDCFNDHKAFQKLVGIINGPIAISLINKKKPDRLLCFWRDIPIYLHGDTTPDADPKTTPCDKDSSFTSEKPFSSITLSTFKSDSWIHTSPFASNTVHNVLLLPQHEIKIDPIGPPLESTPLIKKLNRKETINLPMQDTSSKPKSHLRSEIFEQPQAMKRLLQLQRNHLQELETIKLDCMEGYEDYFSPDQRLVITGCGSSFFAGQAGAGFLNKMKLFRDVRVVNSVEFDPFAFVSQSTPLLNPFGKSCVDDLHSRVLLPSSEVSGSESNSVPLRRQVPANVCVAVSQSGESSDVLNFLRKLKEVFPETFVIALTNSPGSSITKMAHVSFFVKSGTEKAVAATKSVTNTIISFHMLGLWFEYLFRGPRSTEITNFRTKGRFYEKVQALESKDLLSKSKSLIY